MNHVILISLLISAFLMPLKAFCSEKYFLTACAVFKDDAQYLPEWLDFHRHQGIQKIYLYENNSSDDWKNILKPYADEGFVKIISWPHQAESEAHWVQIQTAAYMDCAKQKKSVWCAFLDTDEFLFSVEKKDLKKVIKSLPRCSQILVNWVMYGTSNVENCYDGHILGKLTMRSRKSNPINLHCKSIVRLKDILDCVNPHFCIVMGLTIDEKGKQQTHYGLHQTTRHSSDVLRINHYWSRDKNFFYNHKIPLRAFWGYDYFESIALEKTLNEKYDPILVP